MRSIIDITDLSVEEISELMDTAMDIIANPTKYAHACDGKILATLFFEPSTRTRLSFEAAMQSLGGSVISLPSADKASSSTKGESVADTIKIVNCYADMIAMRHPLEGSALVAARNSSTPIINAGDGGHCHPTQTMADLLTIHRYKGRFDHLVIGLCGDLLYGRTVHSLINAMSRYPDNRYILIAPEELKLPDYVKEMMDEKGVAYEETTDLNAAIPQLDILYMTRIQRERFKDPANYEKLKDSFCLTVENMTLAKEDMCLLHPLPRVNEISAKVDGDPRAAYFDQALNGKFMRMALILKLFKDNAEETAAMKRGETRHFVPHYEFGYKGAKINISKCTNPKCISSVEQELDQIFVNGRCIYCESKEKE
ncbi:MAG: aspartate carbamoyltransferase [Lachnospiraceae bacterium]|nr:aspartate carbamoyltransferase [Lachnospiraceae bacterium]